jgi:phospholipase C
MRRAFGALSIAATFACASVPYAARAATNPIQHVIIVVQDGRSFDNLFCGYPGANSSCTQATIPLEARCLLSDTFEDFQHDVRSGTFGHGKAQCPKFGPNVQYAHVPASEVKTYAAMAAQYVLGDAMFSSTGNPAFEAHQYLIAAQAAQAKDEPFGVTGSDGCVYEQIVKQLHGKPIAGCFSYPTLGDELTTEGLTWMAYVAGVQMPAWDPYGWIGSIDEGSQYGAHVVTQPSQFLDAVADGNLANVTWITPTYANSDRTGAQSATGPAWVASVVDAVGESTFWNTSVVIVTWSGFGGWADHVSPPALDGEGLGFRVPLLVISPYAKQDYVSHVQYEFGSILRFAEDTFGLGRLAASDSRATSIAPDALDFNQSPRAFVPIQTR